MKLHKIALLGPIVFITVVLASSKASVAAGGTPPPGTPLPRPTEVQHANPPASANSAESTQIISSQLGWQQMPLSLQPGNTFNISYVAGTWTVDWRNYPYVGPEGYAPDIDYRVGYWDYCKTVYSLPYGTLLGQVGNGPIIPIRRGGTFTANASGALYLQINDGTQCQVDNAGSITVNVGGGASTTCYNLDVSPVPAVDGSITASPGANCSGTGYNFGTRVTLQARPASGYKFTGWSGDAGGSSTINSVAMTANKAVIATFAPILQSLVPPVVLVHGWHGFPGSKTDVCSLADHATDISNIPKNDFGVFARSLMLAHRDVWIAHIATGPWGTPLIQDNAACLKQELVDIRARTGAQKFVLIAHSMGGLVSRAYIESGDYTGDVTRLITFGTPHDGTSYAYAFCGHPFDFAACQFTPAGIVLFNGMYSSRANGVAYDLIGGNQTPGIAGFNLLATDGLNGNDGVVGVNSAMGKLYNGLPFTIINGNGVIRYAFNASHSGDPLGYPSYFDTSASDQTTPTDSYKCVEQILGLFGGVCPSPSTTLNGAQPQSAPSISRTPTSSGHIWPGQVTTYLLPIDTSGRSQFDLTWITGTMNLTLTSPLGTVIDPNYAAAHLTLVAYHANTIDPAAQLFAAYAFTTTVPGVYTLTVAAAALGPDGTDYSTFAVVDSPRTLTVATDRPVYAIGSLATISASVQNAGAGLTGASVWAQVIFPGGSTNTVILAERGGGLYTGTYSIPYSPGYLGLSVVAQGSDVGTPYARQVDSLLPISPFTIQLNGQNTDSPQDSDGNGKYEALNVAVGTTSYGLGTYLVSGDLVGPSHALVAHSTVSTTIGGGSVAPILSFNGDDIRKSGVNGPYTLTNLTIADQGYGGVPAIWQAQNVYTTTAYNAQDFAATCFVLTTTVAGQGMVSVNLAPNCNAGLQYASGTVVQLSATPSSGFLGWSGDASGTASLASVTMTQDSAVTAHFTSPIYLPLVMK